tara:strand:+ start:531 stop:869 length:339 start_codon:yes stop_codon:yes gene_type:complete
MKECFNKIQPIFNRIAIFNTTDYSNHGNPTPLKCNENESRKSVALYYFSNGRPKNEIRSEYLLAKSALYKERPDDTFVFKVFLNPRYLYHQLMPPLLARQITNLKNKIKKIM